jgi:hypothetical protein
MGKKIAKVNDQFSIGDGAKCACLCFAKPTQSLANEDEFPFNRMIELNASSDLGNLVLQS